MTVTPEAMQKKQVIATMLQGRTYLCMLAHEAGCTRTTSAGGVYKVATSGSAGLWLVPVLSLRSSRLVWLLLCSLLIVISMARTAATNAMPAQQFYAARPIEPTSAPAVTSIPMPQGDATLLHKKKPLPVVIPILRKHKPQLQEATLHSSAQRALQRKGILRAKEVSPILSESDSESESFDDDDQLRFSSSLRPAGRKKKRGWYERDDEYRQSDTEVEEEYDPSNSNSKARTDKRKRLRRHSRAPHSATDMPPKDGLRHAEPEEDAETDWALAHSEPEEAKDMEEEEADWVLTSSPSRKRKRVHFEDLHEEGPEDEDEAWTPKLRRRTR